MPQEQTKTLDDLVKHVGRYPEEAFLFLKEGLAFAAERVHGPETKAHRVLQAFLASNQLDWNDLIARYYAGTLPEGIQKIIHQAGGWEKLNRHVGGRELCWGLRDFALQRWGLMARTVLESWNIRTTADFGRIVFGFIDFDWMQKQPQDSIDDFTEIYPFEEALDEAFRSAQRNGAAGFTAGSQ
jgi:uncharacterized repeat protein (TIGR04138 family)